jgi:hypothetical protein
MVDFSEGDKKEYDILETAAREHYQMMGYKYGHHKLSRYFLALTQKLMPMRVACSGGQVPEEDNTQVNDDDDDDTEGEGGRKKKRGKKMKLSDYAFMSKLHKLVAELEHIRDNDPTGKGIRFHCICVQTLHVAILYISHFCLTLSRLDRSQEPCLFAIHVDDQVVADRTSQAWLPVPHVVGRHVHG